jgi:spore germination cell wall hydrolase CwlJ-like protein
MRVTIGKAALAVQFLFCVLALPADAKTPKIDTKAEAKAFAERKCLTEGLYFEAASEGEAGMRAVAEVVIRRMRTPGYPKTICKVIYNGAPSYGCQFSFACDGARVRPRSKHVWKETWRLAGEILADPDALLQENTTLGALRFHTVDVDPDWESEGFEETITIGRHIFFKPTE